MTTTTMPETSQKPAPPQASPRTTGTVAPRVDIYESDKAYVLLADMPGVAPDGLEVLAEDDELVIQGRVNRPPVPPDYQEFELADYYRAFTLTEDLDATDVTATLRDGVLRVEIAKSGRAQPKKIPVRTE